MMQNELKQPLFLCGMMGTGKSTIGRKLANRYGVPFRDLDNLIEEEAGRTIPEIFQTDGEEEFRRLERQILIKVSQTADGVTALGGGSLQNQHLTDHVKLQGWLIFLDTPADELISRLESSENRPMISDKESDERAEKIRHLMEKRRPLYSQAHITVEIGGLNPSQIVEQITTKLAFYEQHHYRR